MDGLAPANRNRATFPKDVAFMHLEQEGNGAGPKKVANLLGLQNAENGI